MIVKNEEDCIERCLSSAVDVVDEMVIVDTGSTDRTIEICRLFPTRIEKFVWNGSFSDARNYSIEKATGDWILWMDADEELDQKDCEKLLDRIFFEGYDLLTLHLVNYYGEQVNPNHSTDMAHPRLFRNNGLKFINKMHEGLDYSHVPDERVGHLDVKIHHYGYMDSVAKKKGKKERNLRMLKRQIEEGENEYWAYYYIALEHYNHKEYEEALKYANASIFSFLQNGALPPSMVYKLKYSILIATGSLDGALSGIERALMLYPDYVELHFFRGLILFYLKDYAEADRTFDTCLELGEENRNYLILKGTGTFQAFYYKSRCMAQLNKKEEAIAFLRKALEMAPDYQDALDFLDTLDK